VSPAANLRPNLRPDLRPNLLPGLRLNRASLRRIPGATRLVAVARTRRAVATLLAGGRFDVDWYRLQAGVDAGRDERAAARDYLTRGRRAGLSPHPLFEPEWYDPAGWRDRPDDPFLGYLSRAAHLREVSPHLLVDPAWVLAEHPESVRHRHGPFGYLLDEGSELLAALPGRTRVDPATARRRLETATREWLLQEGLRLAPRRTRSIDHLDQRQWCERTALLPLPPPGADGGPVVSVVLPVRGRSALLARAVASVQAQTLREWELIVVDDGSADDTPAVLESLAAADPRIRVITQPPSGVSRARNRGLEAVRGRYVAFLDSDNTWQPRFLDLAVRAMAAQDLRVAHAVLELHQGRQVTYRAFDGDRDHLLLANHVDLNVLVCTAEAVRAIGGFAQDLRRAVDYDLVLRLSAAHPPVLLPFVGAVYADDADATDRISVAEPLAWDFVVRSRHAVDWARAADVDRVPGRLSVVVPVRDDAAAARDCVDALLAAGAGVDLEVIVADLASRRAASMALAALDTADPRIRVHRLAVDTGPLLGVNLVLPRTTGEFVAVCAPGVRPAPGWAAPLLSRLADPSVAAVQALTLDQDGAVAGAGVTFTAAPGQPIPFLFGHPAEDALALGDAELPALWGPLWVARAADLVRVRGLDPLAGRRWAATDVSLRLRGSLGPAAGRSLLVTASLATLSGSPAPGSTPVGEPAGDVDGLMRARWAGRGPRSGRDLWRRAGFVVAGHRSTADSVARDPACPDVVAVALRAADDRLAHLATHALGADVPWAALRWRVRSGAALAHRAEALAAALRRCGEDAVVDVTGRTAARSELDDVAIVLAGPGERPVLPDGTVPAILWLVDGADATAVAGPPAPLAPGVPAEAGRRSSAGGFQLVLADRPCVASRFPSLVVGVLPPATEPGRFRPEPTQPGGARTLVVVGDFARVPPLVRAGVLAALERGVPVEVRGRGWELLLPADVIRPAATSCPQQAAAYATAAGVIVAGDGADPAAGILPWAALDVVSCATPAYVALPEPIRSAEPGGGAGSGAGGAGPSPAWSLVRTFSSPDELLALVTRPVEEQFGDRESRLALARAVALSDSYDARARQLVGLAQDLLTGSA
jgi:O-antigen biosynthesis protein